ncbi:MAG TPA: PQQ-binding-like beta-propeller repeat protein [Thermoguttaceae bacterium]|nr:PQQ-binding-like beta-propeller repeat protein [Thermoguttaceae bacterium]
MRRTIIGVSALLAVLLSTCPSAYAAPLEDPAQMAADILKQAGTRGGIVVHLGCGDGRLTAALRANQGYTVHGLQVDRTEVEPAREFIRARGLYGPVSVERLPGSTLPYVDNLVNLVVAEEPGDVSLEEMMRVLAPGGAACVKQAGGWQTHVKPRPEEIDEWTHFLHDASNNAVARDKVVGPPRQLQWVAPPLWLRSHETPSGVQASVCGGGRIFYIFDEGLIGITDERLPDRWSLVCRDAFNGKLLWQRPLKGWGWREWNYQRYAGQDWTLMRAARTDVPSENQRRLVVDGDRLYTTLGYRQGLSIVDAATGETLQTIPETEDTREILVSDGVVVLYVHPRTPDAAQRRGEDPPSIGRLVAIDGQSGRVLWNQHIATIRPLFLAIDGGRIVHQSSQELVCRELETGKELWSTTLKTASGRTMVTVDGVVLISGGTSLEAYDLKDGALLWNKATYSIGGAENADLFVADGLAWRGVASITAETDETGKPQIGRSRDSAMALGFDLRTGEEKRRVIAREIRSPEHHHRCYRNKATDRYLMTGMEGIEFVDLQGENHSQNNWLRGACQYGILPCNGMIYVPVDQCFCHPGSKVLGFTAVRAESPVEFLPEEKRLLKGPAYGNVQLAAPAENRGDWPTYRHDAARSGSTPAELPADVKPAWRVALGGKLTQAVVADGRVLVAASDAHTVHALDAATGDRLWHFTADGRIDSPPTVWRGLVLFGSMDGRVYCLRAADGVLVWRLTAAPADRRLAAFDQLESVWPVHGSVLVLDGVAYCTAGRSTYLDGGVRVFGLDPLSGTIRYRTVIKGPFPKEDMDDREVSFYTTGANSDILVAEGGFLYMRQKKLTPTLEQIDTEILSSKGETDVGLHLFSTAGLLDGSGYNRTFWMYSKRWPGFQLANQAPKTGQLLVFDDQQTFAVRYFYRRNVHSLMFFPGKEGYLLFADKNTNEPQIVGEPGARTPVRWLPQSDFSRARGDEVRKLESDAFGLDKMIGYTRAEPPLWTRWLPIRIRSMVKSGDRLFVAGPPDEFDPRDPYAPFEGRRGARLAVVSADGGQLLTEAPLAAPPIFDGLTASAAGLMISLEDGSLACWRGE